MIAQTPSTDSARRRPAGRHTMVAISVLIGCIALLALVVFAVWFLRGVLLENQSKRILKARGFDSEVKVETLGLDQAQIGPVRLLQNGHPVLIFTGAQIHYDWRTVLSGVVGDIHIHGAELTLNVNENGKITDQWAQNLMGSAGATTQAEFGTIEFSNAVINLNAPFGTAKISVSGTFNDVARWRATIDDLAANIAGPTFKSDLKFSGELQASGPDHFTLKGGKLQVSQLNTPLMGIGDALIKSSATITRTSTGNWAIEAEPIISAEKIKAATATMQSMQASGPTHIVLNPQSGQIITAKTNAQFEATELVVLDAGARRSLIERVMAYKGLSAAPISKEFAPVLRRQGEQLFSSLNISAPLTISYADANLNWQSPLMVLGGANQSLSLSQLRSDFSMQNSQLFFACDMQWSAPLPLNVNSVQFHWDAAAEDQQFSGQFSAPAAWQDGKTMLAPFQAAVGYKTSDTGERLVNVKSEIKYSGPVPGGTVIDAQGAATISMKIGRTQTTIGIEPTENISVRSLQLPSGWVVNEAKAKIEPTIDLMTIGGEMRPLKMRIRQVEAAISGPQDARHLKAKIDTIDVDGQLNGDRTNWQMEMQGAHITSEDFPSPGTYIRADTAMMKALQEKGKPLQFTLTGPDTNLGTNIVQAENMAITLSGTPDRMHAEYNGPRVIFTGDTIPILPMFGTAEITGDRLNGKAETHVPGAPHTPVIIDFRSVGGEGSALIDIPGLRFSPGGLQPDTLVPALRGKIAAVEGGAAAQFEFEFGGGKIKGSRGRTQLIDLNIGTLVGPFDGVNGDIEFSSMFPLITKGIQTVNISSFDPGIPLPAGRFQFEAVEGGIKVIEAAWPVPHSDPLAPEGPGRLYLSPALWRFGPVANDVVLNIENLSLGRLVEGFGKDKVFATGQVNGTIPIRADGVTIQVRGGRVAVPSGGVIRISTRETDELAASDNQAASYAFQSLQDFNYDHLELRLDGPLDGDMNLITEFSGKNPDVLGGAVFKFNVDIGGPLAEIMRELTRSFNVQNRISTILPLQ